MCGGVKTRGSLTAALLKEYAAVRPFTVAQRRL